MSDGQGDRPDRRMSGGHEDSCFVLDTRGTFCPIPVIKTSEALRNLHSGALLEVISDDPAIEHDLPAWCRSTGHTIRSARREGRDFHYLVEKR